MITKCDDVTTRQKTQQVRKSWNALKDVLTTSLLKVMSSALTKLQIHRVIEGKARRLHQKHPKTAS